jgi:predicted metal-binding membrane protein
VLAALAWMVTERRMGGMSSAPGADLGSLGFYTGTWVTMMAAMMLPSIAPMVLVYNRPRSSRRARGGGAPGAEGTALFIAGYLVTWTLAGLAAYAAIEAGRALDVGVLAWDRAGRELAAAVVLAGSVYQLTPVKDLCLTRCRGPFTFVLEHWHEGRGGALRMGTIHGGWCVGCCWALMATLFALGVMSLGWMAFIAALLAIEKLLPRKGVTKRTGGPRAPRARPGDPAGARRCPGHPGPSVARDGHVNPRRAEPRVRTSGWDQTALPLS